MSTFAVVLGLIFVGYCSEQHKSMRGLYGIQVLGWLAILCAVLGEVL